MIISFKDDEHAHCQWFVMKNARFCSVAKKPAHVPHYFLLKFEIKSLREYRDKILRKYQLSFFFYMQIYS
jgi:hypothetical protein